ncbi:hypothetical protein GCM10009547_46910 [Sporichthya brevicatena]|uniref:Secreted protein n=1 Tax=Sporichthya brevicatena TaxID=171442 RepID=A0ABN1HC09_9ACTN
MNRTPAAAAALLLTLTLAACGGDDDSTDHSAHAAQSSAGHNMADMNGMTMDMSKVGDGTAASLGGYRLVDVKAPTQPGKAGKLTFTVEGPNGVQKDYTRQQTKLMHTYLVRKDLTNYQHIHPSLDTKTGEWSVDLTVPEPGPYQLVTEFQALTPEGEFDDRILGTEITVEGKYTPVTTAPAALGTASVDGYDLKIDGQPKVNGDKLMLSITKDGEGVSTLQPYLASFAHITGFRQGDLSAVHVHPDEMPKADDANATGGPDLTLAPMFTKPGRYRMFIQFQTGGTVHLVPMDLEVTA